MNSLGSIERDVACVPTTLSALSGVGPKRAAVLADRGIATVRDLLSTYRLRYQDWRDRKLIAELQPATSAVVEGRSRRDSKSARCAGRVGDAMATGWLKDAGGARIRVVWFNLPAYMRRKCPTASAS